MAKVKQEPALVKLPDMFGGSEVKFGKSDNVIKLAWGPIQKDGQTVQGIHSPTPTGVLFVGRNGRTYLADFSRYPDSIKGTMIFHGSKQKLGDEYADLDSVDDCFEAMIELDRRLAEGKWDAERKGFAGISVLMKAIMEAFQKTEEEAREFLKDLSPKEKAALRICEELKPIVDRIEQERGKKADITGALAKLKGQQQSPPPANQ